MERTVFRVFGLRKVRIKYITKKISPVRMCFGMLSSEKRRIKIYAEIPATIAANSGPLMDSRTSRIVIGVPLKAKQINGIIIRKLAIV